MLNLIKPPRLRPGDRVGLVAPASPCDPEELEAGLLVLQELGLEVISNLAAANFKPDYLAGSDEQRACGFNEFVEDTTIRAIFGARGGYGCTRILSRISYAKLRLNPKVIVGFSDLTALLLSCHWQAGLVCFHGPTVSSLGKADRESLESLWQAVGSSEPVVLQFRGAGCLRPGRAAGAVVGGNLTTICHLLGTPFSPPLAGRILFLEDRGEPLYRIDRMLTQLLHSGSLGGAAALIVGAFSEGPAPSELNELLSERLAGTTFPILFGAPLGHQQRNLTLPLGLTATLDAEAATLTYHQPATIA